MEDVQQRVAAATGATVVIEEITDERDPAACTRAALAGGAEVVIAAGGDGTVSAVAAELIGQPARLGVIPLGTSNSFGAALGIPADLDGAIATLAAGVRRKVDVAYVTGPTGRRAMVLHCMVGFHADVIGQTETAAKQRWGVLAYAAAALRHLATAESFAVELVTDEHQIKCRAHAVAAANLAPMKSVLAHGPSHLLGDDGRIDVTIVAVDSIAEAIATGVHLYRTAREGAPASRDNVGSFSTARLQITTDPVQNVLVDGEPFGETPVTIETVLRALEVVAPEPIPVEGPPIDASLIGLPELEIDGAAPPAAEPA